MVYGHFPALDCGLPEPLVVFKAVDDRGGGGGAPSDSKLSISSIAFCISESCSRRSGASLNGRQVEQRALLTCVILEPRWKSQGVYVHLGGCRGGGVITAGERSEVMAKFVRS